MENDHLRRYVAIRILRVRVEAARLEDPEIAAAIRLEAAPYVASVESWRARAPAAREVLFVLTAADRLLERVRSATERRHAKRPMHPGARARLSCAATEP